MTRIFLTTVFCFSFCLSILKAESFKWAYKTSTYSATCVDASDNIYTAGTVPVIKYNSNGTEIMRIKAGANDTVTANAISVDAEGNIYICGVFSSTLSFGNFSVTSKGKTDAFWAKFRPNGAPVWLASAGGSGYDYCNAMDIDSLGNIYIAGFFSFSATFGSITLSGLDYRDIFAMNCDSNGAIKWIQSIGGTGANADYLAQPVILASVPGSCIISGTFGGTAVFAGTEYKASGNSPDGYMARLTGYAKTAWVNIYTNAGFYGLKRNKTGDIFACGGFTNATDIGKFHVQTPKPASNILLVRFDSLCNPKWVQTAGSAYYDQAGSLTLDSKDNIYMAGSYSDHALFGNTYMSSKGERDVFYAKFDQYGNRIWVVGIGDEGVDGGGIIGLNKAEDQLFVDGVIQFGSVSFGNTTLTDNNEFYYIADLTNINTAIAPPYIQSKDIKVYPNPSSGNINISFDKELPANATISIYNLIGAEIMSKNIRNEKQISFDHIKPGMYIVSVKTEEGVANQKIEVQ